MSDDKVPVIMRSLGLVGWPDDGSEGCWLSAYDPDGGDPTHPGRGRIGWTRDRRKALVFADMRAGMEAWRAQSTKTPLRPDGKPNRPLTAYTVTFDPAPGAYAAPEETKP